MLSFTNRHKTKALGIATIVLGFIQAEPTLRSLLSPTAYAWLMVIVGAGTVVCGFLNSQEKPSEDPPSDPPAST